MELWFNESTVLRQHSLANMHHADRPILHNTAMSAAEYKHCSKPDHFISLRDVLRQLVNSSLLRN